MTLHCALGESFAHSPPHHWFQVGLPKVSVLPETEGSHPSVGSAGQASGLEAWHGSKTQTNSHSNASRGCQLMAAVRPDERTTRFSSGRTAPTRQQPACFASESRETKRIICVRPATASLDALFDPSVAAYLPLEQCRTSGIRESNSSWTVISRSRL